MPTNQANRVKMQCVEREAEYEVSQDRAHYKRCDAETDDGSECRGHLMEIDDKEVADGKE